MTIDKAIKILQTTQYLCGATESQQFGDAIKLGIEALKRLKEVRERGYNLFGHLLPGETEEVK